MSAKVKKDYSVRVVKQRDIRHRAKIQELKFALTTTSSCKKVCGVACQKRMHSKKCELRLARKQLMEANKQVLDLKTKLIALDHQYKQLQKELKTQSLYTDYLEALTADKTADNTVLETKRDRRSYSAQTREVVYGLITKNVPVKSCPEVMYIISSLLCGMTLKDLPSPSTVAQMAYELGIICNIQIAEFISSSVNLCLSWDATGIDGSHINEIHITANRSCSLVLDVRNIPGGKTEDYVKHVMTTFTDIASSYALFCGGDREVILQGFLKKITCTLTDRAAVNSCMRRQLENEWSIQLVQLNCNVHPLDGIARAARIALLKQVDRPGDVTGHCYWSDSTATNCIYAISVLRYKNGSGDPEGFKTMLRQHKLSAGTFVRYVGNRLHILFHLAGIVLQHLDKLTTFLDTMCTAGGMLKSSLLKDLRNEKIVAQRALGMVGKLVTGPWMKRFYSSEKTNLEMSSLIQASVRQVRLWVTNPYAAASADSDVFGDALKPEEDLTLFALVTFSSRVRDFQFHALEVLLSAVNEVLSRQLKDFLEGGVFESPSPDALRRSSCAPTNNMASESERTLDLLDGLYRRAPRATVGFLNGKTRAILNNTVQYVTAKDPVFKSQLISFATREGYRARVRNYLYEDAVSSEVQRRRKLIASNKDRSRRKAIARSVLRALTTKSVDVLTDCTNEVEMLVVEFIENCATFKDSLIRHIWDEGGQLVAYFGRIKDISSKKGKYCVTISYWRHEDFEEDGEDFDLSGEELFADMILGDLSLL